MFEINCYIHPNDRLNLTNTPIGPILMGHKITKAEIKQLRISYGFFAKSAQMLQSFPAMIEWRLASPFDTKTPKLHLLQIEAA